MTEQATIDGNGQPKRTSRVAGPEDIARWNPHDGGLGVPLPDDRRPVDLLDWVGSPEADAARKFSAEEQERRRADLEERQRRAEQELHRGRRGTQQGATLRPVVVTVETVDRKPTDWFWLNYIPYGAITVWDGDPGLAKSTQVLDLAGRTSRGWAMPPDGGPIGEPGDSVILSAEDSIASTIGPRLDAMGADTSRIHVITAMPTANGVERPVTLPDDIEAVLGVAFEKDARLLVIDPLMAYLGSNYDAHKDQHIRLVLHRVMVAIDGKRIAVVCIRHLNKSAVSQPSALYRGGGSIAIVGAARSGLIVGKHPSEKGQLVLAQTKSNLGPPAKSLAYRLVPAGDVATIGWIGHCDVTADELVQQRRKQAKRDAKEWLHESLALAGGKLPAELVEANAKAIGIAIRTLKRAKQDLGVESHREGAGADGKWYWCLPAKECQEGQRVPNGDHTELAPFEQCQTDDLAPFDNSAESSPATSQTVPNGDIGTLQRVPSLSNSDLAPFDENGKSEPAPAKPKRKPRRKGGKV